MRRSCRGLAGEVVLRNAHQHISLAIVTLDETGCCRTSSQNKGATHQTGATSLNYRRPAASSRNHKRLPALVLGPGAAL
eukprot:2655248-Prymnesium_polylepis.1